MPEALQGLSSSLELRLLYTKLGHVGQGLEKFPCNCSLLVRLLHISDQGLVRSIQHYLTHIDSLDFFFYKPKETAEILQISHCNK